MIFIRFSLFLRRFEPRLTAISTQSWTNTTYGPKGVKLLKSGLTAEHTLEYLIATDSGRATRQVGIVDAKGNIANYTGNACNDWADSASGKNYTAQGNILVGEAVVKAMGHAFEEPGVSSLIN